MKRDSIYFLEILPKTPKVTTSGPNPGSRAQDLGLGQMSSFLIVLGGVYTFWVQDHGFGPDVVIFDCFGRGLRQT